MGKMIRLLIMISDWTALLVLAVLFMHSLFVSRAFNFDEFHESGLEWRHNPVISLIILAFMILLLYLICVLIKRFIREHSNRRIIFVIFAYVMLTIILCLIWIRINPFCPRADQEHVWNAAVCFAKDIPLDESELLYYDMYPRQKSMALIMSFIPFLFGDSVVVFKIVNIVSVVTIILMIQICYNKVSGKILSTLILGLLLISFLPMLFYCTFIYGTLVSIALSVLSLYGLIKYSESERQTWLVLPVLLLPVAYLFYQATLIYIIAFFVLFLSISARYKKQSGWILFLITSACIILLSTGLERLTGSAFDARLGSAGLGDGTTSTAQIVMGLEYGEDMHFPGGHNGTDERLYEENGRDTNKTNEESIKLIKEYLGDYIKGERPREFFIKKTEYQWLDPWFSSLAMSVNDVVSESEMWNDFFEGPFLKGLECYLYGLMLLVYFGALLCQIILIKRADTGSPISHFPGIYFIGGFVFQLIWEQKARYCLPYYLALFPATVVGMEYIFSNLDRVFKQFTRSR